MLKLIEKLFTFGERDNPTPYYLYSIEELSQRAEEVSATIDPSRVFFSVKANRNTCIVAHLLSLGFGLDVSSEWELTFAKSLGCLPERISIVGPWKHNNVLREAAFNRYSKISIESRSELTGLQQNGKCQTPIFVRVHLPGACQDVAENMQAEDSQFGMSIGEITEIMADTACRGVVGFHYYDASDVVLRGAFERAATRISEIARILGLKKVQWGPGIGESYDISMRDETYFADRVSYVEAIGGLTCEYEVGRYLVASCGALIITVLDIKNRAGRPVVITDGGITAFARTAITSAIHPIANLSTRKLTPPRLMDFRGPTCTPLDRFQGNAYFDTVNIGDKLAILRAGAYGEVLALRGFVGFNNEIPVRFLR